MAESTRELVRRLNKEFEQTEVRGDVEALGRIFDDDLVWTSPRGQVADKQKALEIASGVVEYDLYESEEMDVRLYGDEEEVAVVVGKVHREGRAGEEGQDIGGRSRYTRVWARRPEGWRLVAVQMTFVDDG
jgi:ketosteroid isomerase-like protein